MGHSCRTLLWDTLIGHSCGTLLRDTLVRHSCGTRLWGTLVGHSYGTLYLGHSCRTLLWVTLVGSSCGALFWDTLDTTNHPAHQRHAVFTPACFALPSGTAPRKRTFHQGCANLTSRTSRRHTVCPHTRRRALHARLPPKVTRQVSNRAFRTTPPPKVKIAISAETCHENRASMPHPETQIPMARPHPTPQKHDSPNANPNGTAQQTADLTKRCTCAVKSSSNFNILHFHTIPRYFTRI